MTEIKSTTKPLVPVDPDKLSGMLDSLLAVIEQQQATIDRQAETLQQALGRILDRGPR